jgi:hypothetical protein
MYSNYKKDDTSSKPEFKRPSFGNYKKGNTSSKPDLNKSGPGKEPLMISFVAEPGEGGMGGDGMSALNQLFSSIFKQPEKSNSKLIAPIEKETKFDLVKEYDDLPFKVEGLEDLIKLSKYYEKDKPDQFGINMKRLYDISSSLEKLNNVIGMNNVKNW